jgi:hypothetical protein
MSYLNTNSKVNNDKDRNIVSKAKKINLLRAVVPIVPRS